MTTMKFQIQLPVVEIAFAGALMLRGVISAGYSLERIYQQCSSTTTIVHLPGHAEPTDSKEAIEHKQEQSSDNAGPLARVRGCCRKDNH